MGREEGTGRREAPAFYWDREALLREAAMVGVALQPGMDAVLGAWMERVAAAGFNVTGIRDAEGMRRLHVVDALAAVPLAGLRPGEWLMDLGSGAGFPGVPLAVAVPGVRLVLVEARGKKAAFLREAIAAVGLTGVDVVWARAEELARDPAWRGRVDCVVARGLAPLAPLIEVAVPLCRLGGRVVALKGPRVAEEWAEAEARAEQVGGRLVAVRRLSLPGGGERRVIVRIEKLAETPRRFPRRQWREG